MSRFPWFEGSLRISPISDNIHLAAKRSVIAINRRRILHTAYLQSRHTLLGLAEDTA
jgi:hypothetical protein